MVVNQCTRRVLILAFSVGHVAALNTVTHEHEPHELMSRESNGKTKPPTANGTTAALTEDSEHEAVTVLPSHSTDKEEDATHAEHKQTLVRRESRTKTTPTTADTDKSVLAEYWEHEAVVTVQSSHEDPIFNKASEAHDESSSMNASKALVRRESKTKTKPPTPDTDESVLAEDWQHEVVVTVQPSQGHPIINKAIATHGKSSSMHASSNIKDEPVSRTGFMMLLQAALDPVQFYYLHMAHRIKALEDLEKSAVIAVLIALGGLSALLIAVVFFMLSKGGVARSPSQEDGELNGTSTGSVGLKSYRSNGMPRYNSRLLPRSPRGDASHANGSRSFTRMNSDSRSTSLPSKPLGEASQSPRGNTGYDC